MQVRVHAVVGLLPSEALDGAVKIIQSLLRLSSPATLIFQFDAVSAAAPNGAALSHVLDRHVDCRAALGTFEIEIHAEFLSVPALIGFLAGCRDVIVRL